MASSEEQLVMKPLHVDGGTNTDVTGLEDITGANEVTILTVPSEQELDNGGMQVEIVTSDVIYQTDANTQTEINKALSASTVDLKKEVSTQTNVSTQSLEGLSLLVDTAMQTEEKRADKKLVKGDKVVKKGNDLRSLNMVHHEEIRGALENLERDYHKCYICGKVYKNKTNWQNHLKVHAGEQVFLCGYCGKLFQKSALASHVKSHTLDKSSEPANTAIANQVESHHLQSGASQVQSTEIHIQTDSGTSPQEIVIQGLYGGDNEQISNLTQVYPPEVDHQQQQHSVQVVDQGDQHQVLYPSQIDLERLQDATVIDLGIIDVAMQAEVLSSAETPQPVHQEEEVVSEMTEAQDNDLEYLPEDEQEEKTKYIYKCNLCGKEYNNKSNCHRHLRSHTQEKSHQCPVCEKHFTHRYELKMHSRIHTGEKPHKCPICTRAFNEGGNLRRHMKIHIGDDKPYKCAVCYKGFEDTARLQVHTKIHSNQRPFACDTCGKTMTKISDLYRHIRIHTGEKPYVCDICDKSFCQKVNLQTHRRTHTGEKPFRCQICNIGFSRKKSYQIHMQGHEEDSDYEEVMKNCDNMKSENSDKEEQSNKDATSVVDVLNPDSNVLEIAGTIVVGDKTYTIHQNANDQSSLVLKSGQVGAGQNTDNTNTSVGEVGEVVVYDLGNGELVESAQEGTKGGDWAMYVTDEQVVIENAEPTAAIMEIS